MIVGNSFFANIKNYDKDNMDKGVRSKVDKFIKENPCLADDSLEKASLACFSLGKWAKAIVEYSKIAENVAPLRKKVAELTEVLNAQTAKLRAKEHELAKEEAKVKKLEEDFQTAKDKMEALESGIQLCEARLVRAEKLTSGLKNEHERWKDSVALLDDKITRLVGDIFIATAAISYYGPFTGNFRDSLVTQWIDKCAELEIPSSDRFDMSEVMGDPMEIQNWNLNMLPTDPVSVASGILVKYG
jgi:dynein heavy chain